MKSSFSGSRVRSLARYSHCPAQHDGCEAGSRLFGLLDMVHTGTGAPMSDIQVSQNFRKNNQVEVASCPSIEA